MKQSANLNLCTTLRAICAVAGSFAAFSACGQVPYAQGPLLDVVRQMPEGSWQRVNINRYADAWTPAALRPLYRGANVNPSKIIGAWSSFAWDSNRGDLIIYGGGHANYSGNDVYRWRSRTLSWERAALPSEVSFIGSNSWAAIDGTDAAPTSAHTYDNAVFLPLIDRYMNFGGAIQDTGAQYVRPSETNPAVLRFTGPYLFDPERADPNKVGGTTGSHVQRNGPYSDIVGGEMWQNRDIYKHLTGNVLPRSHVNGCTAYSDESAAHDVIYVAARTNPSATAIDLYRYQLTDVDAPELDVVTRVGRYWSSSSAQTTCAYDPRLHMVLRTGSNTSPFYYWNLATAGASNYEQRVAVTGSVKTFVDQLTAAGRSLPNCAMDYDAERQTFLVWCGGGQVWSVTPPSVLTTLGWEVEALPAPAGALPSTAVGVGILGKWKYVPGFDVFIGLQGNEDGNVWVYKPAMWVDPGGEPVDPVPNTPPQIALIAPLDGALLSVGNEVDLRADAEDADGSITKVTFLINGVAVGSRTAPPYVLKWNPLLAGSYEISAQAIDDDGAVADSAIAIVTAQATVEPPQRSVVVIQRGGEFGAGVSDTYLSTYHKTSNFGSSARMDVWRAAYVPLLRFPIFISEGGAVPDSATIHRATLKLYKGTYRHVLAVHAMQVAWVEREATWARPRVGATWSVAGAAGADSDYEAAEDARASGAWSPGWMEFDVTDRVARMGAGTVPNHGWRLRWVSGLDYSQTEIRSSEYGAVPEQRPQLEVEWSAAGN